MYNLRKTSDSRDVET